MDDGPVQIARGISFGSPGASLHGREMRRFGGPGMLKRVIYELILAIVVALILRRLAL
jgi:hypothetical protein